MAEYEFKKKTAVERAKTAIALTDGTREEIKRICDIYAISIKSL